MCTKYLYNFFGRDHSEEKGRAEKNSSKESWKNGVLRSEGG